MDKQIIEVREVPLEEAFGVHKKIPEFNPNPPNTLKEFQDKIENHNSLVLVGYVNNNPVGYCIGYDKFKDGSFYSWMGGVIPEYRKLGVYLALRHFQETWAKGQGYKSIKIKTWNRRFEMRIVLAKLGYNIIDLEKKPDVLDNRLMHEKLL